MNDQPKLPIIVVPLTNTLLRFSKFGKSQYLAAPTRKDNLLLHSNILVYADISVLTLTITLFNHTNCRILIQIGPVFHKDSKVNLSA